MLAEYLNIPLFYNNLAAKIVRQAVPNHNRHQGTNS
jgi:hypothetical protein